MNSRRASDLVTWRYPKPFDCYDMTGADPVLLCDPVNQFYAVLKDDDMIGFRSFGPDGQVPGGTYDASALDTGGGLRPDLVGQGIGVEVIRAGLRFGAALFEPDAFRVTVAAFNVRALQVLGRLGFAAVSQFRATTSGHAYEILELPVHRIG